MKCPLFFRVLVVDDLVTAHRDLREYIRNIIFSLAKLSDKNGELDYVDVVFSGTPDAGVQLWMQESFDLTLIDSHFIQKETALSGDFARDALFINSTYQGLILFKLFQQLTKVKGEKYAYRDWANFVVWSSLAEGTLNQFPGFEASAGTGYWPKLGGWQKFSDGITAAVTKVLNRMTHLQVLERVLTFARLSRNMDTVDCDRQPWPFELDGWRFLIREQRQDSKYTGGYKYPYLDGVAKNDDIIWRVSRRDPDSKDVFLPLEPQFLAQPLPDLVEYLRTGITKGRLRELLSLVMDSLPAAGIPERKDCGPFYKTLTSQNNAPPAGLKFLGYDLPNQFVAAATPLTGTTVVGETNALAALADKVISLLDGPFGAVVLKTTYLDTKSQWEGVNWPALQVQSHMRSRCLFPATGTATLWNTGRTALEMLPPKQLNRMLVTLKNDERLINQTHRVIISLGSKYHHPGEMKRGYRETAKAEYHEIWRNLFDTVFFELDDCFPIVEINVRHFLREIVEYYLGGDEYLNPTHVNEKCPTDVEAFWEDYSLWLQVLHEVAVQKEKKLILKLPYRSDTLALVRYAVSLRRQHKLKFADNCKSQFGVRGITLVNALKTPVQQTAGEPEEHSPAWYASPESWLDAGEKQGKYQMSGALLASYRNQLLSGLLAMPGALDDLAVCVSGGVVGGHNVQMLHRLSRSGAGLNSENADLLIQIGTWALINFNLAHWNKHTTWTVQPLPGASASKCWTKGIDLSACIACAACPFERGHTFLSKEPGEKVKFSGERLLELDIIMQALRSCKQGKLKLKTNEHMKVREQAPRQSAINPRIAFLNRRFCVGCGRCQLTYYCDAFMDRRITGMIPNLESRSCTGCGLCAQVCPHGALQLYKPEHTLVLLDDRTDRHEILNELGLPHLCLANRDAAQIKAMGPDWELKKQITTISTAVDSESGVELLRKTLTSIRDKRVGDNRKDRDFDVDRFCLREGKKDLYSENRFVSLQSSDGFAGDILAEQLSRVWVSPGLRRTYIQAALWAMLIWTDPGQVLVPCPIVAIQTELQKDGAVTSLTLRELQGKEVQTINHVVVVQRNNSEKSFPNIERCESIVGPTITLNDLKEEDLALYEDCGYAAGRIAGLDIRGAGAFLVKDYEKMTPDQILAFAGFPWHVIGKVPGVRNVLDEVNERRKLHVGQHA